MRVAGVLEQDFRPDGRHVVAKKSLQHIGTALTIHVGRTVRERLSLRVSPLGQFGLAADGFGVNALDVFDHSGAHTSAQRYKESGREIRSRKKTRLEAIERLARE